VKSNKNINEAQYRKLDLPDYKDNPFIEALPEIMNMGKVYETLNNSHLFSEAERELSIERRYHLVLRYSSLFQPIAATLDLERKISLLIRSGYITRNPMKREGVKNLYFGENISSSMYSSSFSLMGFPGMGKSVNVEKLLALYPQVILHKKPINRFQIVWLKLNCPHDASLKTLCMSFFYSIDEIIGTNYSNTFGNSRNSVSSMVTHMNHVAKVHAIGVLVIDEIQHLLGTGSGSEQMMNFFVSLINNVGIPSVFIGTMRAREILQRDLRQARRSSGLGDVVWENFREDDDEWEAIVETLWKNQLTKKYVSLSPDIKKVLYNESQGVIDILVKLFWLSQCRAMETGLEKINARVIREVSNDDLKLIKPFTNALKSKDRKKIMKYDDISPIDINAYLQKDKSSIEIVPKERSFSRFQEVMNYLNPLKIDQYKSEIIVNKCLAENKNASLLEITKIVLLELNLLTEKCKDLGTRDVAASEIQKIFENGIPEPENMHKSLIELGLISSPIDDFCI